MAALIKSQITLVDMTDVLVQSTQPTTTVVGSKWINTGSSPYVLYTYSNSATWVVETDYEILNAFSMHDIVLEDMTADGRLTPYEKSQLTKIISPKLTEAYTLEAQASALGSSTANELSNAISALESLYNTYITANPDGTSDVSVTFDADVNAAIEDLALAMSITLSDVNVINESVVVTLSKDSYLIPGYVVNAKASTTTVDVTAYKGMAAIPVKVSVSGHVQGLSTSVANDNTTKATVTVSTSMLMTTVAGSLVFTVIADGKTYKKDFVYAIALTGDYGYTLSLTNESHTFAGDISTALAGTATSKVIAYKGETQLAATFGAIAAPAGMTITKVDDGTTNASLTFTVTPGLTPLRGEIIIPITIDGRAMPKIFSYSVALKGASGSDGNPGSPGDPGSPGKGILEVKDQYNSSTSNTVANGSWGDTIPGFVSGKYIWTRMHVTWTDSSIYTTPEILATSLNETNQKIADMADDGKLTPEEKLSLKRELDNITSEKTQVDAQAAVYPTITTEKTNYNTAYTTLYNYLNPKLTNLTTTEAVAGITLRSYFTDYIAKRELLKKKITEASLEAAKKYAADQAAAIAGQFSGVDVEFASAGSNSITPVTGWQTTAPAWVQGSYIWSRVKTIYSVGNPTYSGPVCISGTKEIGVSTIKEQYNLSSSSTASNGTWVDTMPTFVLGSYLWTRVHITWVDATTTTSSEVLVNTILADRVVDIEMNTTADSIVSAVRASTLYKSDLNVLASKEEAENYSETAKVEAIIAAAEDAMLKANTALNDAKNYADSSVTVLTNRVEETEQKITADAITQTVTSSSTYQTHLAALEPVVLKQTTPPEHVLNRLWLDTANEPNIMYRSNGTTWVKTAPTTASDLGAYTVEQGEALASDLNTAVGGLSTTVVDLAASITSTASTIRSEVAKTYTTASEFGTFKLSTATALEQTSTALSINFTTLSDAIAAVDGHVSDNKDEIKKFIRFEDGDIILGESTSAITLVIENDQISFMQAGNPEPIAYISDNVLYITDGRFLTSLRIGNFAFTPRANGNLSFSKVV